MDKPERCVSVTIYIYRLTVIVALKRIMDTEGLDLDIIEKHRYLDNGKEIIQVKDHHHLLNKLPQ